MARPWRGPRRRRTDADPGLVALLTRLPIDGPRGPSMPSRIDWSTAASGSRLRSSRTRRCSTRSGTWPSWRRCTCRPPCGCWTTAGARFGGVPHVCCFDTAFHATLPEVETRYPVPDRWAAEWRIRRFGFHGLSVEWSVMRAAELLGRPVDEVCLVVAHLGGGCSVTAVDGGRSVRTSMGYTPLEGLMMGTRSGSVDPGMLLGAAARRQAGRGRAG